MKKNQKQPSKLSPKKESTKHPTHGGTPESLQKLRDQDHLPSTHTPGEEAAKDVQHIA